MKFRIARVAALGLSALTALAAVTAVVASESGAANDPAADPATAAALTQVHPAAAARLPVALQSMMLGAAWAGERVVAVGERGTVLLSDAHGAQPRQAAEVPVDATLTALSFVDAQHGWAVGHWGVILATEDGGEHWKRQRLVLEEDRPLFAVHFFDRQHGVAVGLWSLVLTTDDGGKTWTERTLEAPPGAKRADLNLLSLFADRNGLLYATAERGMVLRSSDRGASWQYLSTGYKGSLWSGLALPDGGLLVGGQRGSLLRSDDGGAHWTALDSGGKGSITALAAQGSQVLAVGLDGQLSRSSDGGRRFAATPRADRLSLTAVLADGASRWIIGSRAGLLTDPER